MPIIVQGSFRFGRHSVLLYSAQAIIILFSSYRIVDESMGCMHVRIKYTWIKYVDSVLSNSLCKALLNALQEHRQIFSSL